MKKHANPLGLRFGDAAVIAAVLAAALLVPLLFREAGEARIVTVATEAGTAEYPLDTDQTYSIKSAGYSLTLEIRDGTARVSESDCPGGDCVHTGAISRRAQSIVCLPAHVIVKITGEGSADADWILP